MEAEELYTRGALFEDVPSDRGRFMANLVSILQIGVEVLGGNPGGWQGVTGWPGVIVRPKERAPSPRGR